MFIKHDPNDTKPCPHMRGLVSGLADNALTGIAKWYTEQHVKGCPQCQIGLTAIGEVRTRLRTLDTTLPATLKPEEWAQVETDWQNVEEQAANS